jgi:putative flippase GtrA
MRIPTIGKFLLVGAANTAVGLVVILGAKDLLRAGDVAANICGYAVGLTVSFLLNRRWTFGFHGEGLASLLRFLTVFAISYTANLVTVLCLIRFTPLNPSWCQVMGVAPYSTLLYIGCRWYAFPLTRGNSADACSAAP